MRWDELEACAALEALGALDKPEAEQLRERCARDPDAAAALTRFMAVVASLGAATEPVSPAPGVRDAVMRRIRATPQVRKSGSDVASAKSTAVGSATEHFDFRVLRSTAPWVPGPVPGVRYKILSAEPAQSHALLMIEMAAGGVFPEHDHSGAEDLYVLTGDLQSEGHSLGPGDLLHAAAGSHHRELRSVGGCTAILLVPRETLPQSV